MGSQKDITLNNFFVFNSTFSKSEDEEQNKIIYYYPNNHDIDSQIKNVGLVEAIVQFTSTFKPSSDVNSLHSQKKRQLYYQPEENYWMVLTLNVPYSSNNSTQNDYQEHSIQDNVYKAVLKQAYLMFRLFHGTFCSILQKTDLPSLRQKVFYYYEEYLESLKLAHCDILNVFNGIQFLPLDKQSFLDVQCFVNLLESRFPVIKYVSFLYNEHLIWSGLEPEDMQVVYYYLINTLIPAHVKSELTGGSIPRFQKSPFTVHYGRFINGPTDLKGKSVGKVPMVYLHCDGHPNSYYFVLYRALSASICLFLDASTDLTIELFRDLDSIMGTQLTTIVSNIAEYCSKQVVTTPNTSENIPRFIYFNKLNLAYKSTVHLDNKQTGNLACPTDSVKIIADMNDEKDSVLPTGETIVKTMEDYWVVGKFSNQREFYVALSQKNSSLIDISEEVKKLCETELKGIYFNML